jgi:Lon protease-like protein
VFEARYMDMTRDCMKEQKPFGVCLIREGREVGKPATPEEIGCLATIVDWDMQQLGMLNLQTRGGQRFRILTTDANAQGLLSAQVELIPPETDAAVPDVFQGCVKLLQQIVGERGAEVFYDPHRWDDAVWVGYRLAEVLPIPVQAKQRLLELDDSLARLSLLHKFLEMNGLAQP